MRHLETRREMDTGFRWGNLLERNLFQDPGLDGRMILKYYIDLTEIQRKGMDYINVAEDRVKW
jgi:hypothetical protein